MTPLVQGTVDLKMYSYKIIVHTPATLTNTYSLYFNSKSAERVDKIYKIKV